MLIVLLMMSAFFSSAETALMALSKIRLRHLVEEGNSKAIKVHALLQNPNKLLGAILFGNNVVNIGASALATSLAISVFENSGVGIATGAMTLAVLIFGEITPKSIAAAKSEQMSLRIAGFMSMYVKIMTPVVWAILVITNTLTKIFGGKPGISQPYMTEEEIKTMVNMGHQEGVVEEEEKQMIYNVFEFGDAQVKDIMTPRTEMVSLDVHASYETVFSIYKDQQFSRLPIYEGNTDNILGVLYIKDLVFNGASPETFKISDFMRDPIFTFEFKNTAELFKELREKRVPIAMVLDEYGGTAGLVTMEDLIEAIVGDIRDEYDEHEKDIEYVTENEFIVEGVTRIDELNELIGIDIETEDFDSIGGYIVGECGCIPAVGTVIERENTQFVVEAIDRNRIDTLRIITNNPASEEIEE